MILFLRRLRTFVRPYQTRLVLGLLCGVLFALTNLALVVVIRVGVNVVFGTGEGFSLDHKLAKAPGLLQTLVRQVLAWLPPMEGQASKWEMAVVVSLIPVVMFFRSLLAYLNVYLVNWAAVRAVADLRSKLFDHLQNLPLSFFNQASTGELISRIVSDTQLLQMIIGNSFASLIRDPITIVALFILLLSQQPGLTLISAIVLPICIVPIAIYGKKVRKSARAMQFHMADLSKLMHEAFTGNRIIKAYNLENTVLAQFRDKVKKYVSHIMRVVRANEIPGSALEFLAAVGVALVFFYVIFSKSNTTTPGDFLAFVGSIFLVYQPIKSLTRFHNLLHQAESASQHIFSLLDTPSTIVDPPAPVPLAAAGADVRFEHVDFAYGDKMVLSDINLTVKAGQLVALVGSSGAGKTTLVNLLPRFYEPQRGVVRIGSTDIRQVAIKQLRDQIALVTQETILFHDTLRRNIEFGRPGATDAEIQAAARHASAHEFILQKPLGYDTLAGEKGAVLSAGQRQRITIARAILKNAPILILDEATSSLDAESERAVQIALEKLMEGRTTICIAHRLSTIQRADVIVVLDQGRIVETGTHTQLMHQGGVYQRLYELQFQQ